MGDKSYLCDVSEFMVLLSSLCRRAKALVNKVVEDAGGAISIPMGGGGLPGGGGGDYSVSAAINVLMGGGGLPSGAGEDYSVSGVIRVSTG